MGKEIYPAHIRKQDKKIQTVKSHCDNVAKYTKDFLTDAGLENTGYLIGYLHDIGKYTDKFRKYINDAINGIEVKRGSVNHTFAGVKYVLENFKPRPEYINQDIFTRDICSYAIGAHHGQFDCIDSDGKNGFEYRKNKDDIHYDEVLERFENQCKSVSEMLNLFYKSSDEIGKYVTRIKELSFLQNNDEKKIYSFNFYLGCLTRFIQSSLIDADRKDTFEFMEDKKYPVNEKTNWAEQLSYAESIIEKFEKNNSINEARNIISEKCKKSAELDGNLYKLNVPTGAGKTISSLRFALVRAAKYKKNRVIFVSPLLSILEQNASVIYDFIKDEKLILEHHSNAINQEYDDGELNTSELLMENWDSPIIITTLVQLLDTMFSGKTSCIRRFHALENSIIVVDEVQSVPNKMVSLFNLMISFLSEICNTTVVLCSATQPDYKNVVEYPINVPMIDMVPYDEEIWKAFMRTEIDDYGNARLEEIPNIIKEMSVGQKSILVICNKKNESEYIFNKLKDKNECYHISAAMCMAHRKEVMKKVRDRIKEKESGTVICVSTQVMEAGVDISFTKVVRLLAGMESVVQAAGRCNRNGECEKLEKVHIINCTDENLSKLKEIKLEKDVSLNVLKKYRDDPEYYNRDLSSEKSITEFYESFYRYLKPGYQNYIVDNKNYTIFELLSHNSCFRKNSKEENMGNYSLNQAFKEAGKEFEVFDNSTISVIVPYGEGSELILDLLSEKADYNFKYLGDLLKKSKEYVISLYPYQVEILLREKGLKHIKEKGIWILLDGFYNENTGLTLSRNSIEYMEV